MAEYEMRKKNRLLPQEESIDILGEAEYGVLATISTDGSPYAVPLSYIYNTGSVYFHSAKDGHKIDNLQNNSNVSFAVVGETEPVFDGFFTTYYESVVVFGQISQIIEIEEKRKILRLFVEKYLGAFISKADDVIQKSLSITSIWRLQIDHMSGKAKRKK